MLFYGGGKSSTTEVVPKAIAALRRVPGVELYSLCTHGPARLLLVCPWQAKLALYVGSQQARSNMCEAIGGLSYGLSAGD